MFADVIVDINNVEVDKIFEYSCFGSTVQAGSRVVVPFGSKVIEGIVIKTKEKSNYSPDKIKPILRVLEDIPALTEETLELMEYVCKTCYVTRAAALRLFLPSEMRKGKVKDHFVRYINLTDDINVEEVLLSMRKSAVKQKELIEYLKEKGKSLCTPLSDRFGASALNTIVKKGYAQITKEKYLRSPYKDLSTDKKSVSLTPKQLLAVNSVVNTDKTVSLIFGVTGSGKTEVYLNLINKTINAGKTAIMLVPEIALTPQMLKQLRARFGDNAAILHSGLSAGERFDEWWRLRNGEARIAIGARSAIFAPVENLGLIIIDEEHDGSYTSESSPRYSTIDVAKFRAQKNGAKLVLGSATPSVESYLNAIDGEYNLIELPDRINKKPLPEVEIADMRKEVRRGNNTPFSSILKVELDECLKNGNQAIIFLNQRGYSKTVICTECGHVQKCDSCDVSLTYHREDDALLCHYCGAKYKMITACTECGSPYIRYGGTGTERVVDELQKLYPKARILRMDRDTTQNKEGHFKILSQFANREADILVGTQMIAKGHDFPFVTLVGILDADMSLHFSDYRSGERTFQLLTQVAGRSGRAENAGKVVLQTYSPDNPVLRYAIKYDYINFFKQEISVRKATAFPPFTDVVRILISGEDDEKTLAVTKAVYEDLSIIYNLNRDKFRFFGCMKAPLKRLQNKFRYQVLMRITAKDRELLDEIFERADKYKTRAVSVFMEVNSNNLT
ncbi:MAG: primosomal protein N' [Clostridiales bacterium]|nr:primosomal protein N' [Clostridiales bacterium]